MYSHWSNSYGQTGSKIILFFHILGWAWWHNGKENTGYLLIVRVELTRVNMHCSTITINSTNIPPQNIYLHLLAPLCLCFVCGSQFYQVSLVTFCQLCHLVTFTVGSLPQSRHLHQAQPAEHNGLFPSSGGSCYPGSWRYWADQSAVLNIHPLVRQLLMYQKYNFMLR